jgi:hypothetical protein
LIIYQYSVEHLICWQCPSWNNGCTDGLSLVYKPLEAKLGEDGRKRHVIGPEGRPLTLGDLPSPKTRRWVIRRKAEVVAAVHGGLLSLDEACGIYSLTLDEFLSWERALNYFGLPGLRVTHVLEYRHNETQRSRHRH